MLKRFLFSYSIVLLCAFAAHAQTAASPYSIFGVGIVNGYGLSYHNNMGGLGLSNGKEWILNNVNPAILPLNNFSTFDAGLYAEQRALTTSELSQTNLTGGLSYLTFGFPIQSKKWTMAFGLMPYSNVSYNIVTAGEVVNRPEAAAEYKYVGSGGINQVYMANGWQIIPDFLYVGARIGYAFGTVEDETRIDLFETEFDIIGEDTLQRQKEFLPSQYIRSSRYSDILLEGGIYMKKDFAKNVSLNLGVVYEFGANMNTKRDEVIKIDEGLNPDPATDEILIDSRGTTFLPPKLGVGFSISKQFKWTFGVDYYYRDWSQFKSDFGSEQPLVKSQKIILGGEFTPDLFSATSYFKRVTYQFGFNYEQTPIEINNTSIDDFGINFGVSLPVGSASILNFGATYGQLGTTSDGLIRENYLKFNLGMTFNDRSFGWYRNQRKLK